MPTHPGDRTTQLSAHRDLYKTLSKKTEWETGGVGGQEEGERETGKGGRENGVEWLREREQN